MKRGYSQDFFALRTRTAADQRSSPVLNGSDGSFPQVSHGPVTYNGRRIWSALRFRRCQPAARIPDERAATIGTRSAIASAPSATSRTVSRNRPATSRPAGPVSPSAPSAPIQAPARPPDLPGPVRTISPSAPACHRITCRPWGPVGPAGPSTSAPSAPGRRPSPSERGGAGHHRRTAARPNPGGARRTRPVAHRQTVKGARPSSSPK